jgi:hypothetical protein
MEHTLLRGGQIKGLTLRRDVSYVKSWHALIPFADLEAAGVPSHQSCLIVSTTVDPEYILFLKAFVIKYGLSLVIPRTKDQDFRPITDHHDVFSAPTTFPKLMCGIIVAYMENMKLEEVSWILVMEHLGSKYPQLSRGMYFGVFHGLFVFLQNKLVRVR